MLARPGIGVPVGTSAIALCVTLATLIGASCGTENAPTSQGDTNLSSDAELDTEPDTDSEDVFATLDSSDDTEPDDDASEDATIGGDRGVGETCVNDFDCLTGLCVAIDADVRVCTSFCASDLDCPEGSDCLVVANSGTDVVEICVPRELCVDDDEDEYGVGPGCVGRDCDDTMASVNPAAEEACNGVDDDCDGRIDDNPEGVNLDCNSGFPGVCANGRTTCEAGTLECVSLIAPTPELCDGLDNDCDGNVDEAPLLDGTLFYADADEDSWGDLTVFVEACDQPDGYVRDASDCDDTNEDVNIIADEICNGVDDDCDRIIDDNPIGVGADCTSALPGVCAPGRNICSAGGVLECIPDRLAAQETCDGLDNDCDGETDEGPPEDAPYWYRDSDEDRYGDPDDFLVACEQPTGYVLDNTDCNDASEYVNPLVDELCDDEDNDCDTRVDENVTFVDYFPDTDDDGYGDGDETPINDCTVPDGYVADDEDCDDTDELINPEGIELCDLADNDCDGDEDENRAVDAQTWYADSDRDGYGNPLISVVACYAPASFVADSTDCNDGALSAFPGGIEVCDELDNDCNDLVDDDSTDATTWYFDGDDDNFGDDSTATVACDPPGSDWVPDGGDCRDDTPAANPGQLTETCDNIDNDCNNAVDDGLVRECSTACGVGNETCSAGSWVSCDAPPVLAEVCNREDDDCDGTVDEGRRMQGARASAPSGHRGRRWDPRAAGILPRALRPQPLQVSVLAERIRRCSRLGRVTAQCVLRVSRSHTRARRAQPLLRYRWRQVLLHDSPHVRANGHPAGDSPSGTSKPPRMLTPWRCSARSASTAQATPTSPTTGR